MSITRDTHFYRGFFLSQFAALETTLELYIASFFIDSDKKYDLMNIILNRLTFEAKRTALKTLLDSKFPDFVKTKNNSWPSSGFIEELRLLNMERNIFAHYVLTDKVKDDAVISMMQFRDKSSVVEYDRLSFDSLTNRIYSATEKIQNDTMV